MECDGNVERAVEWLLAANADLSRKATPSSVVAKCVLSPRTLAVETAAKAPCTPPQTSTENTVSPSLETTTGHRKRPQKTLLAYFGRKS
jgi:hypothetical protein